MLQVVFPIKFTSIALVTTRVRCSIELIFVVVLRISVTTSLKLKGAGKKRLRRRLLLLLASDLVGLLHSIYFCNANTKMSPFSPV